MHTHQNSLFGGDAGAWVVNSDGACKGNPGPAAWGIVVMREDESGQEYGKGYIGVSTNQVAELTAAIEGLSRVPEKAKVTLVSDSQYVLKGLTEWRSGWERRGWRSSKDEPVKNMELWKRLFKLADARKVTTQWVKGHAGHKYNQMADDLANAAIAEAKK